MTNRRSQIQGFESPNWRLFRAFHQTTDALDYRLPSLFACTFPLLLFLMMEETVMAGATHCLGMTRQGIRFRGTVFKLRRYAWSTSVSNSLMSTQRRS